MIIAWLSAVIGGAAALGSTAFTAGQTGKMNKRTLKYNWQMYDQQRKDAKADREWQMAMNSPKAQMQRLRDAGLNPNLVYGSGADAQTAPDTRGASAPSYNPRVPQLDLSGVVQSALATQQAKANITLTQAQADATRQSTKEGQFDLAVKEAIGIDAQKQKFDNANAILNAKAKRSVTEFEAWFAATFKSENRTNVDHFNYKNLGHKFTITTQNLIEKTMRAGLSRTITELENAKKTGNLRDLEAVIKRYQKGLIQQGLAPDSPWYLKTMMLINDHLEQAGGGIKALKNLF